MTPCSEPPDDLWIWLGIIAAGLAVALGIAGCASGPFIWLRGYERIPAPSLVWADIDPDLDDALDVAMGFFPCDLYARTGDRSRADVEIVYDLTITDYGALADYQARPGRIRLGASFTRSGIRAQTYILAHELGHIAGLRNLPRRRVPPEIAPESLPMGWEQHKSFMPLMVENIGSHANRSDVFIHWSDQHRAQLRTHCRP